MFAGFYHDVAHSRSIRPSTQLILFWLLTTATQIIRWRTWLINDFYHEKPASFALVTMLIIISATLFVLENIPRRALSRSRSGRVSPETSANFFSMITFWWLTPLMTLGYRRPLNEEDLWELKPDDTAHEVSHKMQRHWQREVQHGGSLLKTCCKAFGGPFAFAAIFKVFHDCLGYVQPMLLKNLMNFTTPAQGYWIASTFPLCVSTDEC